MSKRADIINSNVDIYDLLIKYGYDVSKYKREQQFSCDLHGDTSDDKPSARVYPDSNSWYCFACGKARDVIETVRDKESCDFNKACYIIEEWYGLEHYVYSGEKREEKNHYDSISHREDDTVDSLKKQIEGLLGVSRIEKTLSLKHIIKFWELYDMVTYHYDNKLWDYDCCLERLQSLKETLVKKSSEYIVCQNT
jgi:hypothetical protein